MSETAGMEDFGEYPSDPDFLSIIKTLTAIDKRKRSENGYWND